MAVSTKRLYDFSGYLQFELKFDPKRLKKYEPGDIIDVDFGFNVGAELGGRHYAVVVEDNARSDGTIMVIPLSSYKSPRKVHSSEVDLGVIPELNQHRGNTELLGTKAKISHLRSISKMRIYYPRKKDECIYRLTDGQLKKIYDVIQRRFCSRFAGKKG
jgi:mRNA interferase MazF